MYAKFRLIVPKKGGINQNSKVNWALTIQRKSEIVSPLSFCPLFSGDFLFLNFFGILSEIVNGIGFSWAEGFGKNYRLTNWIGQEWPITICCGR
jgi:hypothetical protein